MISALPLEADIEVDFANVGSGVDFVEEVGA
jgi:hypothetical protein